MKHQKTDEITACLATAIIGFWVALNFILGFFLLFLIHLRRDLYPYAEVEGYPYPSIIDSDALLARLLFSHLGVILGFFSLFLATVGFYETRRKKINLIFMFLMIFSVLSWSFFLHRAIELNNLNSWLESCEKSKEIFFLFRKTRSCH